MLLQRLIGVAALFHFIITNVVIIEASPIDPPYQIIRQGEVRPNVGHKRYDSCPANLDVSSDEFSPLQRAATDGDLEKVKFLVLTCKADVNAINSRVVSTALHEAAYQAKIDVIKFLISHGADPNLPKVPFCMHIIQD